MAGAEFRLGKTNANRTSPNRTTSPKVVVIKLPASIEDYFIELAGLAESQDIDVLLQNSQSDICAALLSTRRYELLNATAALVKDPDRFDMLRRYESSKRSLPADAVFGDI